MSSLSDSAAVSGFWVKGQWALTCEFERATTSPLPRVPAEPLHQSNLSMKEHFEDLSAWKEQQREQRVFLETKLEEARVHIEELKLEKQKMGGGLEEVGRVGGAPGDS